MIAQGQVRNFNSTSVPTTSISSISSRSSKRTPSISETTIDTSNSLSTSNFFDTSSVPKSSTALDTGKASTSNIPDNGLSITSVSTNIESLSSNNITSTHLPSSITNPTSASSFSSDSRTRTQSSLTQSSLAQTSTFSSLQTSNNGSPSSDVSPATSVLSVSTSPLSSSFFETSNFSTPITTSIWHPSSISETSSKYQTSSRLASFGFTDTRSTASNISSGSTLTSSNGNQIFSSFTGLNIVTTTIKSSKNAITSSTSASDTSFVTTTSQNLWTETQFVVATSVVTINVDSNGNTYATPADYQSASSTSMWTTGDYSKSVTDYVQVYQITDTSTTFECSVTTTKKPKHSTITTDSSYYNAHLKSLLSGQSSGSSSTNSHGNSHKILVNSLVGGIVGGVAGVFFILLMGYYAYKWLNRRQKVTALSCYLAGDERVNNNNNNNNNESGFQHGRGRKVNIYQEREMMDDYDANAPPPGIFSRQKENIKNFAKSAFTGTGKKSDKNANPFNEEFDFRNRNFVMPQAKSSGQKQEMQPPIIVETTAAAILRGSDHDNSFSSDDFEDSTSPNGTVGMHDIGQYYGGSTQFDPFADQHPFAHEAFSSDESFSDMSTDITSLSPNSRPPSQSIFTERL